MVEIPDESAKKMARYLRDGYLGDPAIGELADLLDPPAPSPPSLRDQCVAALEDGVPWRGLPGQVDAVLEVVREAVDGAEADQRKLTGSVNEQTRHAFACGARAQRIAILDLLES